MVHAIPKEVLDRVVDVEVERDTVGMEAVVEWGVAMDPGVWEPKRHVEVSYRYTADEMEGVEVRDLKHKLEREAKKALQISNEKGGSPDKVFDFDEVIDS